MSNRAERAGDLYSRNFNCAQAVVTAFSDITGFDEETSLRVASSFGGGMGNLRSICGALTGTFLVLGVVDGFTDPTGGNKRNHTARVQKLADAFREKFGMMNCSELLRRNEEDGSVNSEARPCLKYVVAAIEILEDYLEKEHGSNAGKN